jgi:hypothetical protein
LKLASTQISPSERIAICDGDKAIGPDATALFYERGVINDWEYQFQQSTMRKRNLSEKQMLSRRKINEKVLASVRRRGLG